ncbi:hypothetical protein D9M71_253990 [compost metagenome]
MFHACTQAQVQALGGLPLLEHEQRQAVGIGVRDEGFLTQGGKFVAADLGADHAFHRPERLVAGFDARFITFVLEGGVHLTFFDFTVFVVGVAGIDLERSERAVQVTQLGGECVVVLLHVQTHTGLGHRAVVAVVAAVRQAGITVVPMVGTTRRATVLAAVAVFQAVSAVGLVGIAHFGAAGVAGDTQVVELAAVGIQVQGEGTVAGLQLAGAATGGVGAAVAQFTSTLNALDGRVRNAVVEGVDHAADGVTAIEQGGRAADDLDTVDADRVQRHGVVVGQRRGIQGANAIAQDANAVAIQATDYRAAGARAEPGGGDPGLLVQGFTEAAVLLLQQFVAFEHGAGGGQLAVAQRVGGNDLGFEFHGLAGRCGQPQGDGEG